MCLPHAQREKHPILIHKKLQKKVGTMSIICLFVRRYTGLKLIVDLPDIVMSQGGSIQFQPPGSLPGPGYGIGPDPLAVPGNTIIFSPWTYDNVPAISTTQMQKGMCLLIK